MNTHPLSLILIACVLLFLGAGSAIAGGSARNPVMASIEKQGDFVILGFDDMTTRVYDLATWREIKPSGY